MESLGGPAGCFLVGNVIFCFFYHHRHGYCKQPRNFACSSCSLDRKAFHAWKLLIRRQIQCSDNNKQHPKRYHRVVSSCRQNPKVYATLENRKGKGRRKGRTAKHPNVQSEPAGWLLRAGGMPMNSMLATLPVGRSVTCKSIAP